MVAPTLGGGANRRLAGGANRRGRGANRRGRGANRRSAGGATGGVAPIGAEGWRQSLLGSRVSRKTMRTIRVGRAVIDEQLISRAHWRDEL